MQNQLVLCSRSARNTRVLAIDERCFSSPLIDIRSVVNDSVLCLFSMCACIYLRDRTQDPPHATPPRPPSGSFFQAGQFTKISTFLQRDRRIQQSGEQPQLRSSATAMIFISSACIFLTMHVCCFSDMYVSMLMMHTFCMCRIFSAFACICYYTDRVYYYPLTYTSPFLCIIAEGECECFYSGNCLL